jgi:hypothetical protein
MASYFRRILRQAQSVWPSGAAGFGAVDWNAVVLSLIATDTASSGSVTWTNTAGLVTAIAYPMLAVQFTAASTQYASITDNAALSMGAGVRCTFCAWAKHDTVAADQVLISKGRNLGGAAAFEYSLNYESALTRYVFRVTNGAVTANRQFNGIVPITAGVWRFVAATYDGTNINISVNGAAFESTAFSADIWDSTFPLRLGANSLAGQLMNGAMDAVGVWKRALSLAEIQTLYKGGVGMAYQDLSTSLKTSLVAFYNLDSNFADSHGASTLTGVGGPTFVAGVR